MESAIESFIKSIPKAETHLHLEGALPYRVLHAHDPVRHPANPEFLRPDFRFTSFKQFQEVLGHLTMRWFTSTARYHEAAKAIFADLAAQNVRYVEASIFIGIVEYYPMDPDELLTAIRSAVPEGLEVKLIGGLTRDGYTPALQPLIDRLHRWHALDGIDLQGQEWLPLEPWAPPVWHRCRAAGKIVKAHAGEFGGPAKIREAIDVLGVERIEHGVRAVEDPALVEQIAQRGLPLDVCPISNERLGVVPALEQHPIRQLVDAGVVCTLSTDDPLVFGNTLEGEYRSLAERLRFDLPTLVEIAANGFRAARLDAPTRRDCIAEIERFAALAADGSAATGG